MKRRMTHAQRAVHERLERDEMGRRDMADARRARLKTIDVLEGKAIDLMLAKLMGEAKAQAAFEDMRAAREACEGIAAELATVLTDLQARKAEQA